MKVNSFPELVKYIRKEILSEDMNQLEIQFWDNEIVFGIYDSFDITINVMEHDVYDMKTGECNKHIMPELVCELLDRNLTTDELKECHEICKLIEENIDLMKEIIE